jgi:multidrug efflux pump subunit AcrA (membrane-fusion protein)
MKRPIFVLTAAAILFVFSTVEFVLSREHPVNAAPVASATPRVDLISAPGRVEAISEEIRVSSELSGRLHSVPVEEGDRESRPRKRSS